MAGLEQMDQVMVSKVGLFFLLPEVGPAFFLVGRVGFGGSEEEEKWLWLGGVDHILQKGLVGRVYDCFLDEYLLVGSGHIGLVCEECLKIFELATRIVTVN